MDIVDVVGDFVSLKRSGQNYRALSPFTNEKTPSFYVVPSKGIFKDFSSGKGGDAITFVMEHEGMAYLEAIRYLAKKYGVDLKEDTRQVDDKPSDRESLLILMQHARDYYANLLYETEDGRSIGLSYFRERGFHDQTIHHFELGYSLSDWDHFTKHALQSGFSEEMLEKAGLTIRKEGGRAYDRFRGRVIFPVHNLAGKVIAFGARILTKEKDQPKYINSPETEIYHKSHVLYGMYQAKNAIRREDGCYLVEGYTDVISLHQSGVDNAVASSGTALTEDQIRLVKRFTENVTVLFDGDAAGIKAALRGVDLILAGGLNVRVVLLPDGEDPDSYSKKLGSTAFKDYLTKNTKDFISFKIDLLSREAHDPIRKAEAIREIVNSIGKIPDPIKRSVYIRESSDLMNIAEPVLLSELNKLLIAERKKQHQEQEREQPPIDTLETLPTEETIAPTQGRARSIELQERESIRLLLNYADVAYEDQRLLDFMLSELDEVIFTNETYRYIYETFKKGSEEGSVPDIYYFMEHGTDEVKKVVTDLITPRYETSKHWSEKYHIYFAHEREMIQEVAYTNVLRMKFRLIQKLIDDNLREMKGAKEEADLERFFTIHEQLKGAEKELAGVLGIVVTR